MKKVLMLIAIAIFFLQNATAESRIWTNKQGKGFEGELIDVQGKVAKIKRTSDGKVFIVWLNTLSDQDVKFIQENAQKSSRALPKQPKKKTLKDKITGLLTPNKVTQNKEDKAEETAEESKPFTDWMDEKELRRKIKEFQENNIYPSKIEGKLANDSNSSSSNNGEKLYRAVFEKYPIGKFEFVYELDLKPQHLKSRNKRYGRDDFGLKSSQSFVDKDGETRHQAVWIFSNNIGEYSQLDSSGWMLRKDFLKYLKKDVINEEKYPVRLEGRQVVIENKQEFQFRVYAREEPKNTSFDWNYCTLHTEKQFLEWHKKYKDKGYQLLSLQKFTEVNRRGIKGQELYQVVMVKEE